MSEIIEPFRVSIPENDIGDLRARLGRIRWPDRETVTDQTQGPQLAKVQALCNHWLTIYDWRRCESTLNGLGSSRTTIDGLDIHLLHIRSPEPDALPLLLTHGWPGSVLEFQELVGPLTDPAAHGGNRSDAFHLVIPSLPGFGFSEQPATTGWGVSRIADAWITLMDRLGYTSWAAHGGDWGAAVTTTIGYKAPPALVGIHLTMVMFQPTPDEIADADAHEESMLADAQRYHHTLSAYATLQGTRPQTIGYSLADSPVGLATWIYTLFQDVSDNAGSAENVLTTDQMLDDITLYWLTNTGPSSARLYWESMTSMSSAGPLPPMSTPAAISMFPREQIRLSHRWADSRFADLRHFNELPAGGHFAALEQPTLLVDEIRAGLRAMR